MNEEKNVLGTCLCQSVTLSFSLVKKAFDACHCGICRKWGGGPYLSVHAGNEVHISGKEFVTSYNSSSWAERGFCKNCGTHLFYRLKSKNEYHVPLGLLDGHESFEFKLQIFIDRCPANYSFSQQTKKLTEEEVFSKVKSFV